LGTSFFFPFDYFYPFDSNFWHAFPRGENSAPFFFNCFRFLFKPFSAFPRRFGPNFSSFVRKFLTSPTRLSSEKTHDWFPQKGVFSHLFPPLLAVGTPPKAQLKGPMDGSFFFKPIFEQTEFQCKNVGPGFFFGFFPLC